MSEEQQPQPEEQQEWPEDQAEVLPPEVWTKEIGRLFGVYNQQIMQLTGQKAELEYSIGQVANVILQLCPELIQRKPDGAPESVCDCAVRLIVEYVQLRKKVESGEGTVPALEGGQAGDPGQGAPGDGAPDQGLGGEGQPGGPGGPVRAGEEGPAGGAGGDGVGPGSPVGEQEVEPKIPVLGEDE